MNDESIIRSLCLRYLDVVRDLALYCALHLVDSGSVVFLSNVLLSEKNEREGQISDVISVQGVRLGSRIAHVTQPASNPFLHVRCLR